MLLYDLDLATGTLTSAAWPDEWLDLLQEIGHGPVGRRGPGAALSDDPMLLQVPIFSDLAGGGRRGPAPTRFDRDIMDILGPQPELGFGPPPGGPGGRGGGLQEVEWMIFELDPGYLERTWLPELVVKYLNPGGQAIYEVQVRAKDSGERLFASGHGQGPLDLSLPFNTQGRIPEDKRGPGLPIWLLQVWHHHGALEALVGTARRRNLIVAVILNVLILSASGFLLQSTRRSRKLAEDQMNFAANVSHELRTPLTVIRGAAHNVKRGVVKDPGRVDEYMGMIIQHADQLTAMVEQVMEYAGLSQKSGLAARAPVPLEEVLHEAMAATAAETDAAGCTVHLDIGFSPPNLTGDPAALRRVFQNLIGNAAKHGGKGGWIGVLTRAVTGAAPAVEIEVADRGPGIPEGEQADIFKPFTRGAGAQAAQTRGSGLGLSLVREIVEAHGGSIAVRSRAGQGASFIVRLPLTA